MVHVLRRALAAGVLVAVGTGVSARADEPRKARAVDLRGARIRDVATAVSVPIGSGRSLVLGLPAGFWVQCPRYLPVPTSMTEEGVVVQFLNARGGSPSLLYLGVEPLAEEPEREKPAARLERAARDFVATLAEKYRRVEFTLATSPVPLAPSTIEVDGKRTPCWRTGRYETRPAGEYGGPRSVLSGECVLFRPEGADVLVHVALDTKSSGTSLDRALKDVRTAKTSALHPNGRVVQINDLAATEDGRFPVRLLSYDGPPGFAPSPSKIETRRDTVYAEDRRAEDGRVTGSHRLTQHVADRSVDPAEDAASLRSGLDEEDRPLREVALATPGVRAFVFSHSAELAGRPCTAQRAVLRFDDLTLVFVWYTFGDEALAAKDAAAFDKLLSTMQLAVRW